MSGVPDRYEATPYQLRCIHRGPECLTKFWEPFVAVIVRPEPGEPIRGRVDVAALNERFQLRGGPFLVGHVREPTSKRHRGVRAVEVDDGAVGPLRLRSRQQPFSAGEPLGQLRVRLTEASPPRHFVRRYQSVGDWDRVAIRHFDSSRTTGSAGRRWSEAVASHTSAPRKSHPRPHGWSLDRGRSRLPAVRATNAHNPINAARRCAPSAARRSSPAATGRETTRASCTSRCPSAPPRTRPARSTARPDARAAEGARAPT